MNVEELIDILKHYDPSAYIYLETGYETLDFREEEIDYVDDPHYPKVYFKVGDALGEE